jgi:hypothetical protein
VDAFARLEHGTGEPFGFLRGGADEVVSEALGGLGADPGQAMEGLDEALNRLGRRE